MSSRLKSKERNTDSAQTSYQQQPQFVYIDYELANTDTLHNLSMKFGVSIIDLKRLNSLQNDRDIYALKHLKIPIKPNSFQSELYAGQLKYSDTILTRLTNGDFEPLVLVDSNKTTDVESNEEDNKSLDEVTTKTRNLIAETNFGGSEIMNDYENESTSLLLDSDQTVRNANVSVKKQAHEARRYFKKMDNKLESLINQNQEIINVVKNKHKPEMENLVPISNISYSVETRSKKSKMTNSFFNFNVRDILIIALLVIIIVPLVILFYRYVYIKEHEHP
jgi:LysM repeat protein